MEHASLEAQRVKRVPAMWETQVWSLGQEDPLEKEMATHSSILARRIPWTEQDGRLQSTRLQRVGHNWVTSLKRNIIESLQILSIDIKYNQYIYNQLIFNKRAKAIQWSTNSLLNKQCWSNWRSICKKMNLVTYLT